MIKEKDYPQIMPNQLKGFNGDTFVCEEFLKLKEQFNIKRITETGTALAGTTKWFCENFDEVHTIEINQTYYDIAKDRCKEFENLTMHLGSSEDLIQEAILSNNLRFSAFFLDAHWGGHCPLEQELTKIGELCTDPIIAIHDFKVPDDEAMGFDSINGQPFTYEWLKPYFDKIYPNGYDHYYNSDQKSTEIKRGVIYLTPKI